MSTETPSPLPQKKSGNRYGLWVLVAMTVIGVVGGTAYWMEESQYIYTDKAEVSAPLIKLGPQKPGILKRVYVHEGDALRASQIVARVDDESVNAQVDGLAVIVEQNVGAPYQPGQAVVTMIEPKEMRVVATIDEDKGLNDIYVGQRAIFTVDAFGSTQFEGTVDSISPTKRDQDVVFNISDKREAKQYDVKISYDKFSHPVFQNGMSARVWIVK